MQDYYELYLESTKLLAAPYVATDEIEAAKKAYGDSIEFIKSIRFGNAQTIKFVHKPEEIQDQFVYHPVAYIEAIGYEKFNIGHGDTCIMVLKKSKSENSTLFIGALKECVKVTNNKLTSENIL